MSATDNVSEFNRRAMELVGNRKQEKEAIGKKSKRRGSLWSAFDSGIPSVKGDHIKAFLIGLIAICLTRLARYYAAGTPLFGEDLYWAVDIIAGLAAAYVVPQLITLRAGGILWWNAAGMAVALTMMHNLVHYAPGQFSRIFSPAWVETVLVTTTPNSIVFRGMVWDKNGMWSAGSDEDASNAGCGASDVTGAISGGGNLIKSMGAVRSSCF